MSAAIACPDCSAVDEARQLIHDETCPVGLAIDGQRAADRAWFERHPGIASYLRPVNRGELTELQMLGQIPPGADPFATVVSVTRVSDDVRRKHFHFRGWAS
jgi:hypothetical protein